METFFSKVKKCKLSLEHVRTSVSDSFGNSCITSPFYTPWKHQNTGSVLIISGGIERALCCEMSWKIMHALKKQSNLPVFRALVAEIIQFLVQRNLTQHISLSYI